MLESYSGGDFVGSMNAGPNNASGAKKITEGIGGGKETIQVAAFLCVKKMFEAFKDSKTSLPSLSIVNYIAPPAVLSAQTKLPGVFGSKGK